MMAMYFALEILFGAEVVAHSHGITDFIVINYVIIPQKTAYLSICVKLEDFKKLNNKIL